MEAQNQEQLDGALTPEQLLTDLKSQADLLGITYSPNIKYETLKAKVVASKTPVEDELKATNAVVVDAIQAQRLEMTKLIRCIISSNDPAMREHDTTPFYSVSNSLITLPKRTFPLNVEWHVPQAFINFMGEMKCGIPTKTKDEKGRTITTRKSIKKYNINILPPLTEEELASLKAAQIMRDGL